MQFAKSSVFHIFHRCRDDLGEKLWKAASLRAGERVRSVDARWVPEEEAFGGRVPRSQDLEANVVQGVLAAEGEVLQPGHQPDLLAGERDGEVSERERHRP